IFPYDVFVVPENTSSLKTIRPAHWHLYHKDNRFPHPKSIHEYAFYPPMKRPRQKMLRSLQNYNALRLAKNPERPAALSPQGHDFSDKGDYACVLKKPRSSS